MALRTKKIFAELVGMDPKNLSAYIKRGQIAVNGDGLFDDKDPLNKAFIQKHQAKSSKSAPPAAAVTSKGEAPAAGEATLTVNGHDILPYDQANRLQRHLDAKKTEHEVELLVLKKAKLKGEMIPSALLKPAIKQHNQSLTSAFKNGSEELIRKIGKKKGLSGEEIAELRGELIEIINHALQDATATTVKAMKQIISEHSQTRGVGERV